MFHTAEMTYHETFQINLFQEDEVFEEVYEYRGSLGNSSILHLHTSR